MSTCTSQDTYISQGTISVHCSFSSSERHLIFVPSNDYSVKQGNKIFAVFVSQSCGCTPDSCGCKPGFCNRAIIRECDRDKGKGVKILMTERGCMKAISGAALCGTKVELEVKDCILAVTMDAKKKLAEVAKAEAAKKAKAAKDAQADVEKAQADAEKAQADAEKAQADAETTKKELMQATNENSQCLTLIGITVPAK